MNDQAILEQLAQHPGSRAVQLADRIDIDLQDVQASLVALVAVGDVVATPGTSPAGNACQFYDLSKRFKASDAYKPLAVRAVAAKFAAANAGLDPDARAIAFVLERGTASSYELHVVMGLEPGQIASSALGLALADGRLAKDGKNWTLGPAAKQEPIAEDVLALVHQAERIVPSASNRELMQSLASPGKAPAAIDIPKFLPQQASTKLPRTPRVARIAPAKVQPAPAAASSDAAPVYRCALWSDGILEVRRDGETVAEIQKAIGESIAAFLGRLVAEGAAA